MLANLTDPISTCQVDFTHLQVDEFHARDDRARAIALTVATHETTSGHKLQVDIPRVNVLLRVCRLAAALAGRKKGPSRRAVFTTVVSRRITIPDVIHAAVLGSTELRGGSLHLEQRLGPNDRALVGKRVKPLDRQVIHPRRDKNLADRSRGQAIG